ncbi:hypothetical protein N7466_000607 [Penicillium verhagenii]|uniref:uncharacterized protein n=1 Tax=Penicillium verhagenii TaxID=1562060 RepID=UPI0025451970|nr:uncharacterized protein N7466_000607 [Penicillium verhagenii]KAJ5947592.1 hypothetical protein N7466_000607 [Penicillium verhagenii]
MTLTNPIRRVAVIGAGPSGLAAVKYLREEKYFEQIDVFEQRSSLGGAWNYTPSSSKSSVPTTVPHLNPHEPVEKPIWINQSEGARKPIFVSPVYEKLETNIPKELMQYSDHAFPEDSQLFPEHETVKQYLEAYAEDTKSHIQFETQVNGVKLENEELSTWALTATKLQTGTEATYIYDAVVVASGHFNVPYVPDIPGIEVWDKAYAGAVSHSKLYDSPEVFRERKVVVVGSSASGLDIAAQINEVSKEKVIVSQKSESYLAASAPSDKIIRPQIVEFMSPKIHDRGLRFADGHIEDKIDAVVFCTGYLYSFPFLSSLEPAVITDGWRTKNVYRQLFYINHPTLAFPVLSQRVVPFVTAENQAAVFSRVWSGRLHLPEQEHMKASENSEVTQKGDGKAFHVMPFPMDVDYLNLLHNWATSAKARPGLEESGRGKLGKHWGDRERWMRALFPEIRRAFVQIGEQRSKIKTLEALGFDFETWKRDQEQNEGLAKS